MMAIRHNPACKTDRGPGDNPRTQTPVQFVDVHCHCLPNLDDGPESMEEALVLCRALAADHIMTVVATPHQLGRFEDRTKAETIRRTVGVLNHALRERGIDLTVLPGAEVRVDERIDEMLAAGEILTLADAGCHVLLELPWDTLIDIEPLLVQFRLRGVKTILAHPERNGPLLERWQMLGRWMALGVGLQVTAGSLTGRWGRGIARAAWGLVAQGGRTCLATDAHDGAQCPGMTQAFAAVAARWGDAVAYSLLVENPARVIRGEELAPVFPPEERGIW
ncbi:MAG: protein tyrosine phosphatase [Planctomycetes bacterium]|nr:protein tyrosine phosphatase [Planctomycetota bacterium]